SGVDERRCQFFGDTLREYLDGRPSYPCDHGLPCSPGKTQVQGDRARDRPTHLDAINGTLDLELHLRGHFYWCIVQDQPTLQFPPERYPALQVIRATDLGLIEQADSKQALIVVLYRRIQGGEYRELTTEHDLQIFAVLQLDLSGEILFRNGDAGGVGFVHLNR